MHNLSELFYLARNYGRVTIFTSRDGTYSCNIDFNTIEHTELSAKSGHNHKEVESAVTAAIKSAEAIVASVSTIKVNPLTKLLTSLSTKS